MVSVAELLELCGVSSYFIAISAFCNISYFPAMLTTWSLSYFEYIYQPDCQSGMSLERAGELSR